MSQTFEATFDGEVFRPTEAVDLKPDTRVQLIVTVKPPAEEKSQSFLRVARSFAPFRACGLVVATRRLPLRQSEACR